MSQRGAQQDSAPNPLTAEGMLYLVGAVLVGLLGFLVLPSLPGLKEAAGMAVIFRGLVAGGIIGLMGPRRLGLVTTAVTAAACAFLGAVALSMTQFGGGTVGALASVVVAASVAAGIWYLVSLALERLAVVIVFGCVVTCLFWTAGVLGGPNAQALRPLVQRFSTIPQAQQYQFDGDLLLRIPFLMRQGVPYYAAFTQSVKEDARMNGQPPTGKLNYREPLLFYIWKVLPSSSPEGIRLWFLVFATVVMAAGYRLSSRFVSPSAAMLAPVLLAGYFAFAAVTAWFGIVEFWGGGVAVLVLACLLRRRWLLGAFMLVIAVAIRELMIYLIPAFVAAWAFYPRRRDEIPALLIGVLGPVLALGTHLYFAPQNAPGGVALSQWFHGGPDRLIAALKFAGDVIPGGRFVLLLAPAMALAGSLLVPRLWRKVLLVLALAAPLVSLYLFSLSEWGYYWGAILQPLALSVAPVALLLVLPSRQVSTEVSAVERIRRAGASGKVRVVVPLRNAAGWARDLLASIGASLDELGRPYAILVVDDASTDGTEEAAKAPSLRQELTVRHERQPVGHERVLEMGLRAAASASRPGDVVIAVDPNHACDASCLGAMLRSYDSGATAVVASRYVLGSQQRECALGSRARGLLRRLVLRALVPVEGMRDYQPPFRLFEGCALQRTFGSMSAEEAAAVGLVGTATCLRLDAEVEELPARCQCDPSRKGSWPQIGLGRLAGEALRSRLTSWGEPPVRLGFATASARRTAQNSGSSSKSQGKGAAQAKGSTQGKGRAQGTGAAASNRLGAKGKRR